MIICGFMLSRCLATIERVEKLLHVLAVDLLDVEPVCFETRRGVFALRGLRQGIERDRIRIVNQDEIIETKMGRERARFRGDAFLQTAVTGQADDVLVENSMFARVEMRRGHFRGNGDSHGVGDTLAQRVRWCTRLRAFQKIRDAPAFSNATAGTV